VPAGPEAVDSTAGDGIDPDRPLPAGGRIPPDGTVVPGGPRPAGVGTGSGNASGGNNIRECSLPLHLSQFPRPPRPGRSPADDGPLNGLNGLNGPLGPLGRFGLFGPFDPGCLFGIVPVDDLLACRSVLASAFERVEHPRGQGSGTDCRRSGACGGCSRFGRSYRHRWCLVGAIFNPPCFLTLLLLLLLSLPPLHIPGNGRLQSRIVP
jgi:hypothetical protein